MNRDSLKILEALIAPEKNRQKRLTDLLRPFDKANLGWFMFVPTCFNAALDIQETARIIKKERALQWTQGSKFAFSVGDILYNTPKAYEKWSEAVVHIRYCFHVTEATPVSPANSDFQRQPGKVKFDILVPDESKIRLACKSTLEVSQDEFVRLLIGGASSQLTLSSPDTLF